MTPELLPTLETPLAWIRDYRDEIKTSLLWAQLSINVMLIAFLVGWRAADRRHRRTYGPPASAPPPPYNDLGVDLIGRPARYDVVDLEDRGLGGYADDDGAYEIPLPLDPPPPPPRIV